MMRKTSARPAGRDAQQASMWLAAGILIASVLAAGNRCHAAPPGDVPASNRDTTPVDLTTARCLPAGDNHDDGFNQFLPYRHPYA